MSSGSKPAGTTTQTINKEPWEAQQPFLKYGFDEAQNIYGGPAPEYYAGSTVNPMSGQSQTALQLQEQRARMGSPLLEQAQDLAASTMGGGYLGANPAMGTFSNFMGAPVTSAGDAALTGAAAGDYLGSNPYLDAMYGQAAGQVRRSIDSQFERGGRYGQGAHQGVMGETLGNLATNIYGQNYERERARQQQAAQQLAGNALARRQQQLGAGSQLSQVYDAERQRQQALIGQAQGLGQADYDDIAQLARAGAGYEGQAQAELQADIDRWNFQQAKPATKLADYMGMIGGGYGTSGQTSTPFFNPSTASQVLGGAMGGAGMAAALNASNPWGWGMTGLGALSGLL